LGTESIFALSDPGIAAHFEHFIFLAVHGVRARTDIIFLFDRYTDLNSRDVGILIVFDKLRVDRYAVFRIGKVHIVFQRCDFCPAVIRKTRARKLHFRFDIFSGDVSFRFDIAEIFSAHRNRVGGYFHGRCENVCAPGKRCRIGRIACGTGHTVRGKRNAFAPYRKRRSDTV